MGRSAASSLDEPSALTGVHTEMHIEPYEDSQLDAVIRLSLRAWTPVFDSIGQVMDLNVYREFYPDDWRVSQQKAVEQVCAATDTKGVGCDRQEFNRRLCSRETPPRK